jgi:hypothetical protein
MESRRHLATEINAIASTPKSKSLRESLVSSSLSILTPPKPATLLTFGKKVVESSAGVVGGAVESVREVVGKVVDSSSSIESHDLHPPRIKSTSEMPAFFMMRPSITIRVEDNDGAEDSEDAEDDTNDEQDNESSEDEALEVTVRRGEITRMRQQELAGPDDGSPPSMIQNSSLTELLLPSQLPSASTVTVSTTAAHSSGKNKQKLTSSITSESQATATASIEITPNKALETAGNYSSMTPRIASSSSTKTSKRSPRNTSSSSSSGNTRHRYNNSSIAHLNNRRVRIAHVAGQSADQRQQQEQHRSRTRNRLYSLDVFRGSVVMLMIIGK